MSKESISIKINTIEQYDSIHSLFKLLRNVISVSAIKEAHDDLVYTHHHNFYCSDCDNAIDDCYCHADYPDYSAYDDEASFE